MKRAAIVVALLVAMLWQSVALVRAASPSNPLGDLRHALMHWQDDGHHHHDDGSFHHDDSDESVGHVMADNVNGSALVPQFSPQLPAVGAGEFRMREARAGPDPYLDGLIRPPRPTA